ncbi:MAG: substrate-binding domain-containing protein [Candidatus Longimicrobiales bacterium M2_2A_002]
MLAGCGGSDDAGREPAAEPERVLLVTTTTVEASGLLEELVSAYHAAQDRYRLSVTAVGSGAALALGRRGDADLLVTHDPIGEAAFMDEGFGAEQGPLMRNEFIVVGPPEDPAAIRGTTDLAQALDRVAEAEVPFVSRGDESGTHRRERQLWSRVGRAPWETRPSWYIESGSGMDETLRIADQRGAYALSGRSTYLNLRGGLRLRSLARGNPPEINAYQWTLPTDPPNPDGARHLRNWLVGPGQDVVAGYGVERFGQPLFTPTASALDTLPAIRADTPRDGAAAATGTGPSSGR